MNRKLIVLLLVVCPLFIGTTYIIKEGGVEVGTMTEDDGSDAIKTIETQAGDTEPEWSDDKKEAFLEGCIASGTIPGLTRRQTEVYCNCNLGKVIQSYPDPATYEDDLLPADFVSETQTECFQDLKRQ